MKGASNMWPPKSALIAHWAAPSLMDRLLRAFWALGIAVFLKPMAQVSPQERYDLAILYHPWRGDTIPGFMRQVAPVLVLLTYESPYEYDLTAPLAAGVDVTWDSDLASAHRLPYPSVHFPHGFMLVEQGPITPIASDICFLGQPFPYRADFVQRHADFLRQYDVLLSGHGWDAIAPWARTYCALDARESLACNLGAKIVLNIHRRNDADHENRNHYPPSSPNNRLFDLAGLGVFQLVDDSRLPELRAYYSPAEVPHFSEETFETFVSHFLAKQELRCAIAAAARERTRREHTTVHRLARALAETRMILGE